LTVFYLQQADLHGQLGPLWELPLHWHWLDEDEMSSDKPGRISKIVTQSSEQSFQR